MVLWKVLTAYVDGFRRDEEGQGMAEYAVILAVIAVVVAGVLIVLAGGISDALNSVKSIFDNPSGTGTSTTG